MHSIKRSFLGSLVMAVVSTLAHADGLVIVDDGRGQNDEAKSVTLTADGHIIVQACPFIALDNSGTVVGPTRKSECRDSLVVRSDNLIFAATHTMASRPAVSLEALDMFTGESGGRRTSEQNYLQPYAIAFHPDETRIVVGGGFFFWMSTPPYNDQFYMTRFLTNAFQTDTSFGVDENGSVTLDVLSPGEEYVSKLISRADGALLASGVTEVGANAYDALLALYDRDGLPIDTFGALGVVRLSDRKGHGVDMDSTGRVYLSAGGKLVTRLNSNGSVDTSFVSPNHPADTTISDIKVDSSGRVIVFGTTGSAAPYQGYLARLTTTGALDTTFGGTGEITVTAGQGVVKSGGFGALEGGTKPVLALTVATESDPGVTPTTDVAVFRYTATGTPDTTFGANQPDADVYPDPFSFADKVVPAGSANVMSNPVTITGIVDRAPYTIEAGSAGTSVSCDRGPGTPDFYTTSGFISAGSQICLLHDAAPNPGEVAETRINIGGRISSFKTISTNDPLDLTPDPFTFEDQPSVDADTHVVSNSVTITGLTGRADATVVGGTIGCFVGQIVDGVAKVANGDTLCVFHQSSKFVGRTVSTTLTIGGVSDTFTSTVTAADTTPDAFSFDSRIGVPLNDGVRSNAVRITGINRPTGVMVSNGLMSIGCTNAFTGESGTISEGQELCLWHNSATQPNTSTITTVYVGQGQATFTSTTAAAATPNPPTNGNTSGGGGGGALDWLSALALGALLQRALRRSSRLERGLRQRASLRTGITISGISG